MWHGAFNAGLVAFVRKANARKVRESHPGNPPKTLPSIEVSVKLRHGLALGCTEHA